MASRDHDTQHPYVGLNRSERRLSLVAVISCIGVAGIGFGLTFPLLGLAMERMRVPEYLMGVNAAMFAVATLTFAPLVPKLMRRIRTVHLLALSILVCILSLLSFKVFENIWIWFPLRYILGASLAVMFVVSEIWINQLAGHQVRGRVLALYGMSLAAGMAAGPVILLVTSPQGWQPFITGAVILGLAAVPPLLVHRLAPEVDHSQLSGFWTMVKKAPTPLLATILFAAFEGGMFNFLPIYGVRTAFTEFTVPQILVALALGSMGCQLFIGWLADRGDKRQLMTALAFLSGIGALALPWVIYHPLLLFPTLFIWGGVFEGLYTVALSDVGARFSGADLAVVSAAMATAFGLGELLGPIIVGLAMNIWGLPGLPVSLALMAAAYCVFALYRRYHLPLL